jgi:glucan 1,3-beta-glucosidase
MHFSTAITTFAILAGATAHLFEIPEVTEAVNSARHSLSAYLSYHGPTGAASAFLASSTPKSQSHNHNHNHSHSHIPGLDFYPVVSDPPYWLADISHQGYAPYSANPASYKVFRSVKDYGAVGMVYSH